ncbi:hypothetical protein LX87_04101 [Larkinella arboricola]|uniref:Uncharacterized protein n=1 Tax=Larkinella arboricola TaxID=643671 RepID=A0A327WQJ4_LARAB|nr:hypothetical protein [Larkinella arboricola]RAJ94216.1 hypothetical protein LX87_04101 [Larkinella arboricola]
MKRNEIFNFLLAALAFAVAVVLPSEVFSALSDPSAVVMIGMATVSFANLDGSSFQKPNPGGTRTLLIALSKDIKGVWPKLADIQEGEVATIPELKTGKQWAEYEFPDGTFDLNDDASGDPGFQSFKHSAEFMIAGMGKTIQTEIMKHLNAGSVVIGELNDGQFFVAGSSDNALYFKPSGKSGKKGNDKRGYTMKGEQDGFMWPLTPLKANVVAALSLIPSEDAEDEEEAGA